MGIIKDLNEAAAKTHNKDHRALAQQYAITISERIRGLHHTAGDYIEMQQLVGMWTRASKLLEIMSQPAPPNPLQGGLEDGAVLKEAA